MNIFGFSFFERSHRDKEADKSFIRRPVEIDATGGLTANTKLLEGLYYGSVAGLQFASPLAFTPVAVPVSLVSIPTPVAQTDQGKEALKLVLAQMRDEFGVIERTKMLRGTAWRWVRWDSINNRLVWEAIPDQAIQDIEIDPTTFEIKAIYTDEQFTITTGRNQTNNYRRKRRIAPDRIDISWSGDTGNTFGEKSMANPFGFMPIAFGHDCAENEWRGHSVFARILRSMKSAHDIELARDQILAQFRPKMIQEVDGAQGVKTWINNNGIESIETFDPFKCDLVLNIKDKESTTFEHLPSEATAQYTTAKNDAMKSIIIGSGIPELFWGPLATGNHASTETQKDLAISYINDLRSEDNKSYETLFNQSLAIMEFISGGRLGTVEMSWDSFDMIGEEQRANIFDKVASGVSRLVANSSGTKDDVLFFLKRFYPSLPEKDIETFSTGLGKMAIHSSLSKTDPLTAVDLAGTAEQ